MCGSATNASWLKLLYKQLVEHGNLVKPRNHENEKYITREDIEHWRNGYKNFCAEVDDVCQRLENGEKLSPDTDKDFLERLLRKHNRVADPGQSTLSDDNFDSFVHSDDFMSALTQLIRDPNRENYLAFDSVWQNLGEKHNKVLINRTVAACTPDVSTTVDEGKFNRVFDWLTNWEVIPPYDGPDDWFSKNLFLVERLREVFQEELDAGETDEYYLNQLVWYLHRCLDQHGW